jgi:hypothetical protein
MNFLFSFLNSYLITYLFSYIVYKNKKEDKRYEILFLVVASIFIPYFLSSNSILKIV